MPQPSYSDLFGAGSQWNAATNRLEIPLSALQSAGLTNNSPTALEAYSGIIKNGHTWLSSNTDQAVSATSDLTISAPIPRNGIPKTQFQFATRFYGSYSAPEFLPDQV